MFSQVLLLNFQDVEGDSGMRKVLYDINKSKVKLYAASNKVDASLLMNKVQSSGVGVEIALPVTNAPTISNSIVGVATAILANFLSGNDLIKHNFKATNSENVTARTSKKRRKNNKKAIIRDCALMLSLELLLLLLA
ncbi:hypothetical protein CsatB_027043 [Cannabis sativa]